MDPHDMTREDLIASLGATQAKLRATQERLATVEARNKQLLAERPTKSSEAGFGLNDVQDD